MTSMASPSLTRCAISPNLPRSPQISPRCHPPLDGTFSHSWRLPSSFTQWATLVADATKRLGGPTDNRCVITVTDRFGGRGHDYQVRSGSVPSPPHFPWPRVTPSSPPLDAMLSHPPQPSLVATCQVMDKTSLANGGMLVLATSVPDEREWIQWRGRTARQDCPGQYHVVLNKRAAPFTDRPELISQLNAMANPDDRLRRLLEVQDESIGATLKKYALDQELGEQVRTSHHISPHLTTSHHISSASPPISSDLPLSTAFCDGRAHG